MKTKPLSEDQLHRAAKVLEVAERHRNLTLTLVEPHRNPYRDLKPGELAQTERAVKEAFFNALTEAPIPVIIAADDNIKSKISFEHARAERSRGRTVRLVATDRRWFDVNWHLFADGFGFGARRSIFVFLQLDSERLSMLVHPWWDPDVLLNPYIASSRSLLKEVEKTTSPGTVVFSLSLVRLSSCQLYFHQSNAKHIVDCVACAANKTQWWK